MQPEQLGPFRIGRVLGRGGMGAVYEGVHVETGEVAAVKVLLSTLQDDDELRLRFEAEIDTLKRLRHPNIVRLFGFGEEQGMLYYVMELVDGPSLHQEIKRQRLFQWHEAAKIGLEMCLAFKHAHDRGITHRDIKPANILLEQHGTIKLSDFGIAHFFGGHRFTEAHSIVGTLEFMSPEQALANPVSSRSDLYSLGAVLYALLVGRPPFTARSLPEILRKHQNGVVDPIRATRLDVPDELELIIFDLLKVHLEDRPPNAYLVVKRFQSLLQALVGPPELILVKPMEANEPLAPTLGPIQIPYKGDHDKSDNVLHPQGLVVDNGIIDLGGIVDQRPTNEVVTRPIEVAKTVLASKSPLKSPDSIPDSIPDSTPEHNEAAIGDSSATSSADSFGRPVDRLNEQQTLEMSGPLAIDSKQAKTDAFSLSPSVYLPTGINAPDTVVSKPLEPKEEPEESPSEIYGIKEPQETQKTQGIDNKPLTGNLSFRSEIRHGEIVFEDGRNIHRSKDEPIPDINVFDALQRNAQQNAQQKDEDQDDPGEGTPEKTVEVNLASFNTKNDSFPDSGVLTVDGLGTDHVPRGLPPGQPDRRSKITEQPAVPSATQPEPESGTPNKSDELYGLQSPQKPVSATIVGLKERDSTIIDRPSAAPSHFTAVKDEAFNEFDRAERRPIISVQTVLVSIGLILIGFTFYYLLQPIPADTLYERIKQTILEESLGDEVTPSAIRKAEDDINNFLMEHAQHPMAEQVRYYRTELDLAKKELELKPRKRFANSEITNPVELAYIEATALIKTDPEEAAAKFKAIIDVFGSEKQPEVSEPSKPVKPDHRQRLSPAELCVQLSARRLEKLEKTNETTKAEQLESIRGRLYKADELESVKPENAEAIRRGIIELYQHRRWAKEAVEEARQKLKKP